MIVSLMQPYLFPYLGYFQLIDASDVFVSFDTATFSKNGWVNRNRILVDGVARWLTLPVKRDSHALPINERRYALDDETRLRLLRRMENAYRRAPQFEPVYELMTGVVSHVDPNIAAYNANALERFARFMGIETPIVRASDLEPATGRGSDRVIDICRQLAATTYVNSIGGTDLYDPAAFSAQDIELRFLRPTSRGYRQYGSGFVPSLSVIDVLMFNEVDAVRVMLKDRELIAHPSLIN